jgi:hypothetical protein
MIRPALMVFRPTYLVALESPFLRFVVTRSSPYNGREQSQQHDDSRQNGISLYLQHFCSAFLISSVMLYLAKNKTGNFK